MNQKPFIARDTKEPLVILGGYEVAEGGRLIQRPIIPQPLPSATDEDRRLLAEHGIDGLKALGFHGVLDRLSRD